MKEINAYQLKLIAILAMSIDHIAILFVSNHSLLGWVMHMIGRLTMPIMCYFVAEGYYKTRNRRRYAIRLLGFAMLSYYPFFLFVTGKPFIVFGENIVIESQIIMNTIFVLFIGLVALMVWKSNRMKVAWKIPIISGLCLIAVIGDWGYIGVLWILLFGIYHEDFKKQAIGFIAVSILLILTSTNGQAYQWGVFLALPLLARYNGQLGGQSKGKWMFYLFYPAHLLILSYFKYYIG